MCVQKKLTTRNASHAQTDKELCAWPGVTSMMEACSFMALSELKLKVYAVFDAGVAGNLWRQVPFGSAVVVST